MEKEIIAAIVASMIALVVAIGGWNYGLDTDTRDRLRTRVAHLMRFFQFLRLRARDMSASTREAIFSVNSVFSTKLATVILIVIFSAYFAVLLTSIQFHEMWLDEIRAWVIARDSDTIYDLIHYLRYGNEGHPILWYLILMPLTKLTANPMAMQIAQVAIASATLLIVFLYSPFSLLEKIIFPFGYYTLFEYGIKARSYSLGLLLVVILCAVWERRHTNKSLIAVILAALANVHVVFGIISLGFFAAIIVELITKKAQWNKQFLWITIYVLGWVMAAIVGLPASPEESAAAPTFTHLPALGTWRFALNFDYLYDTFQLFSFILGFAPPATLAPVDVLRAGGTAADAAVIGGSAFQPLYVFSGALVCIVVGFSLRKNLPIALFFSLSLIGLLAFSYMKRGGGIWQHGTLFTTLLAAMWLNHATGDIERTSAWRYDFFVAKSAFLLVLLVQSISGLRITWEDFWKPYSNARAVADFIREHGWEKQPIIAMRVRLAVPVLGYLGIEKVFYADGDRWGSFSLSQPEIKRALAVVDGWGCDLTLLTNPTEDANELNEYSKHGWKKAAQFTGAMKETENYLVYRKPCV